MKQSEQYQLVIRSLSDRIVEAQAPIRVLDAIKWDDGIRDTFLKKRCKALPEVTADYYAQRPLGFDPAERRQIFQDIERDITRQLGSFNPVGQIMRRMCREYAEKFIDIQRGEFKRLGIAPGETNGHRRTSILGSPEDGQHRPV